MKNKKVITIILIVFALLLIGGGITCSIVLKEPKGEEQEEKKDLNDPATYKIAELKSIQTSDKKIRLGSSRVYSQDGITGMMLNVIPTENFDKVYLKITLKLEKSSEEVVIELQNLQKSVQVEHEIQTLNDWSTLKSWSVDIIPEDEALKIWASQGIQKAND